MYNCQPEAWSVELNEKSKGKEGFPSSPSLSLFLSLTNEKKILNPSPKSQSSKISTKGCHYISTLRQSSAEHALPSNKTS